MTTLDIIHETVHVYILSSHPPHAGFLLGWFSTLKMEAIRSSETSVSIWTTQRHIPEDDNIHNYHCENIKSDMYRERR
jgi:hypothetical protein